MSSEKKRLYMILSLLLVVSRRPFKATEGACSSRYRLFREDRVVFSIVLDEQIIHSAFGTPEGLGGRETVLSALPSKTEASVTLSLWH